MPKAPEEAVASAKIRAEQFAEVHPELAERANMLAEQGIEVPNGAIPVSVKDLKPYFKQFPDGRRSSDYEGVDAQDMILQIPTGSKVKLEHAAAVGGGFGPAGQLTVDSITSYRQLVKEGSSDLVGLELNYFGVPDGKDMSTLTTADFKYIGTIRYDANGNKVVGRVKRVGEYRADANR